ncbi:MAG: NIL domain-containing protein, partial [Nitrospinota bacterium]|nr:NIL domain-containing protein [Nitrospinota bacterium]
MSERFFAVTFPVDLVKEPVLYSLVQRYGLEPVIYKASVGSSAGWLVLSLAGPDDQIDAAALDLKCRGALVREGDRSLADLQAPESISSVKIRLIIPPEKVREPIYGAIIREHGVTINIRQANIGDDRGVVDLEISGELESIDSAIDYLKSIGAQVDPIEKNVI